MSFSGLLPDVMGMNARNRGLVLTLNPQSLIAIANHKEETKRRLERLEIPIPQTIAMIDRHDNLAPVYGKLVHYGAGFVVKPAQGSQGHGIVLFTKALPDGVVPLSGPPWKPTEFVHHIQRILAGEFSAASPTDVAIIEKKLLPDKNWILEDLCAAPDLRILVREGEPRLAMARLPTLASAGRANLHAGGVGVGIDMVTGRCTHAILKERPVTIHPDSGLTIRGRLVDGFPECLELARRCAQAVPLGYMGVDIIRDRDQGPVVIEINARPGLAIQLANRVGLRSSL